MDLKKKLYSVINYLEDILYWFTETGKSYRENN